MFVRINIMPPNAMQNRPGKSILDISAGEREGQQQNGTDRVTQGSAKTGTEATMAY